MSGREHGAIFIDALISAAIVAVALGAAFQVIADSARRGRLEAMRGSALLVAQSEMAAVGSAVPLASGESAGISGDFVWRVDVAPYGAEGPANAAGGLMKVAVRVRPRSGGHDLVVLQTLRLAPGG
ncbi:MAG: hypothetical protein ACYC8V_05565 [Caulobacteraceae bacterium]